MKATLQGSLLKYSISGIIIYVESKLCLQQNSLCSAQKFASK